MDELHVAETLSTTQVPASNVSKFKLFQLYINVSVSVKTVPGNDSIITLNPTTIEQNII